MGWFHSHCIHFVIRLARADGEPVTFGGNEKLRYKPRVQSNRMGNLDVELFHWKESPFYIINHIDGLSSLFKRCRSRQPG